MLALGFKKSAPLCFTTRSIAEVAFFAGDPPKLWPEKRGEHYLESWTTIQHCSALR